MPPTKTAAFEKFPGRFALRVQSNSLLVAFAQSYGQHPTIISSNRVAVDLPNGLVRAARSDEWDNSRPIAAHSHNPFRELPVVHGNYVSYLGRRFPASGKVLKRCALSPDGSWLSVMSYTEPENQDRETLHLVLRVNVFEVATGQSVAELSGFFSPEMNHLSEDPMGTLDNANWISDRHFLVPTSGYLGAMLCDMRPTAPVRETVWDFVEAKSEILGFWEEPQLVGYFNALNSLRFHAAVRVADDGDYSIKPDLSGPSFGSFSGFPGRLEAGTRSIDATMNYPTSDGKWDVRSMTLMGGRPGAVVATAAHLGPTEDYLAHSAHLDPDPRPLPSLTGNRIAPPLPRRRLPDNLQVTGLDRDASGKFSALSVSIQLTNWPVANCWWNANLVDRNNAGVDEASVFVPLKQQQVTFIFDGSKISGNQAGPPWRLAGVQVKCQVRAII